MEAQNFFWAGNIKFLRNRKRISQDELSERLGISRSKLNAHENGQTKNPTVEDLIRFSEFFHLSIDSLLKVNLSKLSELKLRELEAGNDHYAKGTQVRVLATTINKDNKENVELVPVKAKAGYISGYGDPDYIAQLPSFNLPHLPQNRKYRMFPTTGDSMYPVPENSFVIGEYIEDWSGIKDGTACIVITRNEGIVFKLVDNRLGSNQSFLLSSLNPAYEPYEVHAGEILEIWKFKNYLADSIPEAEVPVQDLARLVHEIRGDVKRLLRDKG